MNKTILLVEDEAIIAVIHKKILSKYGFDVITAGTGEKAVEIACSTPGIDLILMDIDLGEGIDGTEAAERILACKDIPLVFLSSHTEPEVVNKTEGITSYGYIVKNSGETVLIASIRMAFKLFEAKVKEKFKNEELQALNEELEASNEEYMNLQEELVQNVHALQEKEEALRKSEKRVRAKLDAVLAPEGDISLLGLEDIFDPRFIQNIMDDFYKINEIGNGAFLDINGRVLAASGWQEICTKFHRVNHETCKNCIESDIELSLGVNPGEFKIYKCKNNMWDMVTPIYIGGRHMGNLFLGQFLFEGEVPDYEIFREQARKYGFDEKAYLEALDRVPVWSREKVESVMSLYSKFAYQMGKLSYGNLKLARVFEEQKRISEKLKKSEEQYRLISENTSDGIFVYENDEIIYASSAYTGLTGYSVDEILHIKESDIMNQVHPEDRSRLGELISVAKNGEQPSLRYQFRARHKDGHYIWREDNASFVYDDEGNFLRAYVVARDISERKSHEDRIKIMSEMLDEVPGAITVHDYEGNFLYANKNAYSLHGYDEDFLLKKLADIDVPESAALIEERIRIIDKEGEAVFKAEHYRKDGTVVPLEVSAKKVNWGDIPAVLSVAVDITERLKAEEELRTAEETYRNLFLNSQIGIFRSDVETGLILDANDTFASLAGYKDRESLLADSFNIAECYIDPQQRDLMISTLIETGEVNNFESLFKRIDDVQVWMRFSARHNIQKGWLEGVAEDITEKKELDEKLKKSEDRFNRAIVGTGAGLWDWDMVNNTVFFSRKWKSMLGYEDHEVENDFSGWKNLWHPDDVTLIEKAVNDYIEGKTNVYEIVHRLHHRDGSWHWILTRGDLERDETGKPIRWTGTNIDITGRKMAEEALRESEEKYRMLFHHSPLGIYVADCDGNILDANDKLLSILGSPSLEATKSLNVYNLPLLVETGYTDKFRESVEANTVSSIEFNYTSKWGKTTYASNYIVPVADSAGKVEKVFTLVEDITEWKQIEKYRELSGEILSVLNSADDFKDSVSRILLLIREKTGSDAVGIRLCEGDDYPYFIQNGFSNDFILQENSLISRDSCGDICVNNDGDVSLECTCGLVISGKTDSANPLFTPGGSCWTNDSFPLLEMQESEDPRYKARNNCIHHGYASVALVPVKSGNEVVGLLQLNGYAKNLFTIELVQELEIIAARIGETLLRKQNEDKIRALLQEKELLLKETHHRVKNNMNTVRGLLYLQAEELSDPISKGIIKEAASRVQSMMIMYDKLYRSESHHEMNVNDYLPSLIDEIIRIFDSRIPVKTDTTVDDVVLSAKALSSLGIIINELITNSMKYAFDNLDEGLISLSLTKNDSRVTVVYRDNGPGFPESVDFENSTGFGMQLIAMLINQLGGDIRIERGEGTRFVLEFDV